MDASSGIEAGLETAVGLARSVGHPACFVIDKCDRENADPSSALDALRAAFGTKIAPLQLAIGAADAFSGYVDLVHRKAWRFDGRTEVEIPIPNELAGEVALALHQLRAIWDRHDPAEHHLADATLRLALALANRQPGVDGTAEAARAAADRRARIRPVLAYVDDHCRERFTLGDVSELVHVSPSRVRHVFKDVTGVSFKEYVTQVRVAEAKRLLLGTDLSVAEIARSVSYTNLHQFYKVFHRACAMSPGEYRRYYTPAGGEVVPVPAR